MMTPHRTYLLVVAAALATALLFLLAIGGKGDRNEFPGQRRGAGTHQSK